MVSMSHTHLFAKINIFHYWEILGDTQNKSVNITANDKNKFSDDKIKTDASPMTRPGLFG